MSASLQLLLSYAAAAIIAGSTWDPAYNGTTATYSGGNLTAVTTSASGNAANVRSTTTKASGKFFVEVHLTSNGNGAGIGIGTSGQSNSQFLGFNSGTYSILQTATPALLACGGGANSSFGGGTLLAAGDYIGVAINIGTSITFYKNGVSFGTFPYTPPSATYYFMAGANYNTVPSPTHTVNFGATAFDTSSAAIRSDLANQGYTAWDGQGLNPGAAFTTWNPSDKSANITLSNGNLTAANTGLGMARSVLGKSSGKWYWEVTIGAIGTHLESVGFANVSADLTSYVGSDGNAWGYISGSGNGIWHSGAELATNHTSSYVAGDVLGFALDLDNGAIYFGKLITGVMTWEHNTSNVVGVPSSGASKTGAMATGLSGTYYAAIGDSNLAVGTANFGATAFSGAVPAGYNAGIF